MGHWVGCLNIGYKWTLVADSCFEGVSLVEIDTPSIEIDPTLLFKKPSIWEHTEKSDYNWY